MPKMVLNACSLLIWSHDKDHPLCVNIAISPFASLFVMLHEMALFSPPHSTYRKSYSDVDDLFSCSVEKPFASLTHLWTRLSAISKERSQS